MNYSFIIKNITETIKNIPENIQNGQTKKGKQLGEMSWWYNNKCREKKKRDHSNLFIVCNNTGDIHVNGKNQEEYQNTKTSLVVSWEGYRNFFSLSTTHIQCEAVSFNLFYYDIV